MSWLKITIWGLIIGVFLGIPKVGAMLMVIGILIGLGKCFGSFFGWLIDIKNP